MWNNKNWINKSLSLQFLLICVFTCGCGKADKQGLLPLDLQQAGSLENSKSEIRKTDTPLVISVSDRNRANRTSSNWPQWRGPSRTDISNESGLLRQWPDGDAGPKQLWVSHDAGIGYSGPAVVDGVLYTMGALPLSASGLEEQGGEDAVAEAKEYVIAMDTEAGELLWSSEVGDVFQNNWGNGPRSTPTIDGEFIYALGALGDLVCLEKANGKLVWKRSFTEDFGGEVPNWGYCESVLIDGDHLICTPGGPEGAMAALDKKTSEVIWRSTDFTDGAQYVSMIAIENGGKRQYIQLTQQHLVGIDAKSGDLLWSSDWPGRVAVVPTPIAKGDAVYVTSGYGVGCKLLRLDKENQAEEVYANRNMKNHHGGVILLDGHLYGYSDGVGWLCQKFEDGKKVWSEKGELGKGAIAYADDRFYCIGEDDGRVVLIDASSDGWTPRGEFTLSPQTELRKPAGRVWTHPVIIDGRLYLRDQELLHCYDVRKR
ncbi:MAG: PQQ-like beta-propeller repeat protein [Pirellulales bacterium]|nr:PQQ-like beta-propeller repeat protein [Pirellulales bacterium]